MKDNSQLQSEQNRDLNEAQYRMNLRSQALQLMLNDPSVQSIEEAENIIRNSMAQP